MVIYLCAILTLVLTVGLKLWRQHHESGKTWKEVLFHFFCGSAIAKYTTVTYVAAALAIISWYAGGWTWNGEPQSVIPVHWSFALMLGSLMELIVPPVLEFVIGTFVTAFSKVGGGK